MAKKKAMWQQGDPASMMQGGKRIPVSVLGFTGGSPEDEGETGEPKVSIRLTDGTVKEVHPNVLLAPGQVKQYRQRKAKIEKGGVATEANRMAREGYRLVSLLGVEEKAARHGSYDYDDEGVVRMATLLFERDVPAEIEPVSVVPPPENRVEADDESDEPTPREQEREEEAFVGDEPEDRDRM